MQKGVGGRKTIDRSLSACGRALLSYSINAQGDSGPESSDECVHSC